MRKGLSPLLAMTVTVVIVLVAGVTIMSIFTRGMSQVSGLSDQRTSCLAQARTVCAAMNSLPAGWDTVATRGETCASLTGCGSCDCISGAKRSAEETVGNTRFSVLSIRVVK